MNSKHQLLTVGHKASFCLEDNACKMNYKKQFICSNLPSERGNQGNSKIKI